MTGDVGDSAHFSQSEVAAAIIGDSGQVKAPSVAELDDLVGGASVRGLPGAGRIEGVAAMTSDVGNGAHFGQSEVAAAVIGDGGQIKALSAAELDDLVGGASDDRRGGVNDRDRLAALGGVAAS